MASGVAKPEIAFEAFLKFIDKLRCVSFGFDLFLKFNMGGPTADITESSVSSGKVIYPLSETSATLIPNPLTVDWSLIFIAVLLLAQLLADVDKPIDLG